MWCPWQKKVAREQDENTPTNQLVRRTFRSDNEVPHKNIRGQNSSIKFSPKNVCIREFCHNLQIARKINLLPQILDDIIKNFKPLKLNNL